MLIFTEIGLGQGESNLKERKIDFESRQADAHADTPCTQDTDVISDWSSLVEYIKTLPCYTKEEENFISLSKLEGMPPQIMYSIQITKEFKVNCYNRSEVVPTRCLVGRFSAKLETYVQLKYIIKTMDNLEPNLNAELKSCSKFLRELNLSSTDDTDDARCNRINFPCDQMEYNAVKQHGVRYNSNTMRDSINLYLRSRNCYDAVQQ